MPMGPWSWVPPEWSDPYGTAAPEAPPVPVPPSDPNTIDYGSTQEYAAGDYYDEDLGLVNGATGQPRFPQGDAVQDTIKRTVDIAKTLGHPDAPLVVPPPQADPLKERLIAQVAGPRSDVARIAETTGPVGTIGQIGKPVPGLATPPILGERPQPLTPPLLGEVDAVSGVDQPPPTGAVVGSAPMPTDRPIEEIEDFAKQGEAWADLARRDPEGYVTAMRRHQSAEDEALRPTRDQLVANELQRDRDARAEVERVRKQALELNQQVIAESSKLAQQKVDPDRWWDSRNTGQKIAGFISAIVGGLVQGRVGGRNMGLDAINQEIDRDIDAQKANIANAGAALGRKQGLVSQLFAVTGDLEVAAATAKRAAQEQAAQVLEQKRNELDPNGSQARQLGKEIMTLRGQMAAEDMKRQEHLEDRARLKGEYAIKVRDLELRENADQRAAAKAAAGAKPKVVKFEDVPMTADQLRSMGIAIPDRAQLPATGISLNQARKLSEAGASAEEWNKKARENSPEELGRQHQVTDVVDDQGDPIPLRNPEKVAKVMASGDTIIQLLDRLQTARQKYGWSSDLMRSPEWRQMQSDFSSLILEKKNLDELGVIAGPDMELMQKAIGTSDPTEVRDPTPGLARLRDTTVEKINTVRRYEAIPKKGRKVGRWEPPKPPPPAPTTPTDEAFMRVKAFDLNSPRTDLGALAREVDVDINSPKYPSYASKVQAVRNELTKTGGMPPSIKDGVDRLAAIANDASKPEAEQRQAAEHLNELAASAEDPRVREYAKQASLPNPGASPYLSD